MTSPFPVTALCSRFSGTSTGVAELAYIGTCNRIEFMVADEDAVAVQACRDKIGAALGASRAAVDAGYAMWQRAVERSRSWATDEA